MNDSNVVYRIMIQRGAAADTVDDVLGPWPVVVGDSAVAGIRFVRADSGRQIFFVTMPARRRVVMPLPQDIQGQFTDVAVSPSGRYVAYVGADSTARPFAVVRSIVGDTIVALGPHAKGCECDVDLNHARWVTADSFEIAVVNGPDAKPDSYLITSGLASVRRVRTTPLPSEPAWHEARTP